MALTWAVRFDSASFLAFAALPAESAVALDVAPANKLVSTYPVIAPKSPVTDGLAITPVLELAPVYPPAPSLITMCSSPSTTTPSPALGTYPSPSSCHAPAALAASMIDGTYRGTSLPNA